MRTVMVAGLILLGASAAHAEIPCLPDGQLLGGQLGQGWTSCTSTLANGDKVRIISGAPIAARAEAERAEPAPQVLVNPQVDIRVVLPRQVFLPNRATPRFFGTRRTGTRPRFLRERRPRRVSF